MRLVHLIEIKYCEDTRPENQLAAAQEQHSQLEIQLAGAQVTLCTIFLGVGGTIYIPHTLNQLTELGLDSQKAKDLARKLHCHSVQYAHKLTTTRRATEISQNTINNNQGPGSGADCHPPDLY